MSLLGHKTESISRRDAIVDEAMQREAAARLDQGVQAVPARMLERGRRVVQSLGSQTDPDLQIRRHDLVRVRQPGAVRRRKDLCLGFGARLSRRGLSADESTLE